MSGQNQPRQNAPRRGKSAAGGIPAALLYGAVVLVGLVLGAGVFLAASAPTDIIREQLADAVRAETGRELTVSGRTSFSFLPSPGLVLRDVSLSPPPGMGGPPTATIPEIAVAVKLWPLVQRRVEMARIVLRKPVLDLRIDASGRRSWDHAGLGGATRVRVANAGGGLTDAPLARGSSARAALEKVQVGEITIEGGTVRLSDERRGTSGQIDAIDVLITPAPASGPARVKGTLLAAGEPVNFDASLGSVEGFIQQRAEPLTLAIASAPLTLGFTGTARVARDLDLQGRVEAKSASARDLVRWLGTRLPPARGFGTLDFSGDLSMRGPQLSLANMAASLDGATAQGDVAVDSSGARPTVVARLGVSSLNLDLYTALEGEAAASGPSKAVPGPKVKGYNQRDGWSDQPYDTTLLGLIDGEADLQLGGLQVRGLKAGRSAAKLTLAGKRLTWRLDEAEVYGGTVRGSVSSDASAGPLKIGVDLAANGVAMEPLLKDAAQFDWVAGKGNLQITLAGEGQSERELIERLSGSVDVGVTDGAVVGFNVAKILRGLGQGRLADFDRVPSERTDFSEMAARFVVRGGVADNQDLRLVSPLLRVTGAGRVLILERRLDYTVRPRLVASLSGQGVGEGEASKGIEVPVKVSGPWDAPSLHADVEGLLKDPDKTIDAVRELGRQLGGKKTGDFLDKLFGRE